jgi:hypothetical protein
VAARDGERANGEGAVRELAQKVGHIGQVGRLGQKAFHDLVRVGVALGELVEEALEARPLFDEQDGVEVDEVDEAPDVFVARLPVDPGLGRVDRARVVARLARREALLDLRGEQLVQPRLGRRLLKGRPQEADGAELGQRRLDAVGNLKRLP